MCGIAGWLASNERFYERAQHAVPRMMALMRHRGPDDSGLYCNAAIVLGHQRLSILDLSQAGHQPMTFGGRYTIVYNGEVYNYRALARELAALNIKFASSCDTEVVLGACATWGLRALPLLNGMFALAIWDSVTQELLLARDRAGIKPLYFYTGPEGMIFASEIKAIWDAIPERAAQANQAALCDLILTGHREGDITPFAGVRALRAGQYLLFGADAQLKQEGFFHTLRADVQAQRYHASARVPVAEHLLQLDKAMQSSVDMHLLSDAPVGVLCSGGVDSSLITALVHRTNPKVRIFHSTFAEEGNEEAFALQAARHIGCKIDFAQMTWDYYCEHWVDAVWHSDLPIYHPNDISLYSVCELARAHGCKVLLSGEGADELFGGYEWHGRAARRYRMLARLRRMPPRLFSFISKAIAKSMDGLVDLFLVAETGMWTVGFPQASQRRLAHAAQGTLSSGAQMRAWEEALATYDFLDEASRRTLAHIFADLSGHLDTILWRTDRMGMMASIENRVPFLENEIMRYAVNLPLELKVRHRQCKWLLKKLACKYLPAAVVYRPKIGFAVPWRSYLPRDAQPLWSNGFLTHSLNLTPAMLESWASGDAGLRFRLLNLEIWGRLFVLREPLDNVRTTFMHCMEENRCRA
jgi:asparagine synthase (glutamine-hydrolysing)